MGEATHERLEEMGYRNISVKIDDGHEGWPEKASFDGIIVTCAPENIPRALVDQLAKGRSMIIPAGYKRGIQKLIFFGKTRER